MDLAAAAHRRIALSILCSRSHFDNTKSISWFTVSLTAGGPYNAAIAGAHKWVG
jgi:hypothetical protein